MSGQPPYYGQQPPQGYPGGPPPAGYPQQGTSPNPGAPYQYPPPGQAPGQAPYQQPYPGYQAPPPGQQPPAGQYPPPGQPPAGQYPPPGQPPAGQYPNQPYPAYGQQPPPAGAYGQQPPPAGAYGQQPPAPGQYGAQPPVPGPYPPPGQYGAQPPYGQPPAGYGQPPAQGYPAQQWQQPPPQGMPGYPTAPVQATPASQGYDQAQKAWAQPVNTSQDGESLRKAMKGMGCDEKMLIKVLTSPQYANPWAMAQLVQDYNKRFMRSLEDDIKSETRGDLETALLALLRGPLGHDVAVLDKALNRLGTDEEALMDVLLGRSNADMRAIIAEYRRVKNKELSVDIREDVDDTLFRLCSMVLAATRAEDAAPVLPHEIDQKVTELQRATEGTIGANAVSVAQIFTSSNAAQLHAMADAYKRKYHRSLTDVIEKEFRGDMEDALLRILGAGQDRANSDAQRLHEALTKRKDKLFINRAVALYWDVPRLDAAKAAYKQRYRVAIGKTVKDLLKGDLEDVMLAVLKER